MKQQILKYLLITFLSINTACNAKTQKNTKQTTENQFSEVNNLVENLSKKDDFSGTILIAKGDKILYEKAVGLSNKAQNTKNNIDTKFNVGSMNKMFTSVAIAQLVEKNKLNFSDKIIKHLPNLSEKIFGEITIEQLLTHSAGTGDFFENPKFDNIADTAKTIQTYLNIGLDVPLLFQPGAKVKYSNYGFILLGAIIEKASKMSYYDYVRQYIFEVAGMKNTDSYERDKKHENLAIGYLPSKEPNTKMMEVKGNSAGGGYSTAVDFHKFSMALLAGKLVSTKMIELITKGKVILLPGIKSAGLPEVKYAYGFGELFKNNHRIIGHTGGAPGVDGQLEIYPDLGYTVVVLSNYERATMPVMRGIQDIITKNK